MGLLFYSCNANRDLISSASRSGLSISYTTILRHIRALGKDAALSLAAYGKAVQHDSPEFLLLFDNIQIVSELSTARIVANPR